MVQSQRVVTVDIPKSAPLPVLPGAAAVEEDPNRINQFANETGGEVVDARSHSIPDKFTELIDHLRAHYNIAYSPSNTKADGKFHKITLKFKNLPDADKGGAVRTRRGYFAPKEN